MKYFNITLIMYKISCIMNYIPSQVDVNVFNFHNYILYIVE